LHHNPLQAHIFQTIFLLEYVIDFSNSALEIIPEKMYLNLFPDLYFFKQTFLPACFQETANKTRKFELQKAYHKAPCASFETPTPTTMRISRKPPTSSLRIYDMWHILQV
jgi:hypothetical protein